MNRKQVLIILFIVFGFNSILAQECAFDSQRQLLRQNPGFIQQEKLMEEKIQRYIESMNDLNSPVGMQARMGSVITIPVVIHVLHLGEAIGTGTNISDTQIQSSITNLNDFYRGQTAASPIDFEIEFALAQRDPNCMSTTGINRIDASGVPNYSANGVSFNGGPGADQNVLKDLSRWPESDYFNIWIVTEINNNNGGSGFQGYANFYSGNPYEGSVMMHSVFGFDPANANPSWPLNFARDNSTVVHEAGHYFHLYHTFQGDKDTNGNNQCPADVTLGVDSDGCDDTAPHQRETSTCPANNTCTGNPWLDNNTINNIMSYYWCTDLMTNDQKTRARAAMVGTALANSKGDEPVDPVYTAPVAVCSNNTTSTNAAGILGVELNGVSFTSFSSASDGGNIDDSGNCSNFFEIDASISNTVSVTMFPSNFQQLGIWIDWNDDGDFNDDAEKQHYSQDIASSSVIPVVLTYPTTIPYGDYLRIRILTDLDNRYGVPSIDDLPCSTGLIYGQSEDYTIYIQPSAGPITYIYDNGWLPNDPNGIATASENIIVAAGNATISTNTTCNSLTVNAGAGLTINSGVTFTTTDLTLESNSTSYSSLILDGTVSGTINYERHVNINGSGDTGSNDLVSAPLTGQPFNAFAAANPNILNNGTLFLFGPYDKASGEYINYAGSSTVTLDPAVGYRAGTTNNGTVTFTGTANKNTISVDVQNFGPTEEQWNLIGNPYPSYINVQDFLNHEVSPGVSNLSLFAPFTAAIYGYDGNALDDWTIYNLATTLPGTLIAPGQGFFVSANLNDVPLYDMEFTPAMRSTGNSDDFIVGRSDELTYVIVNLQTGNKSYNTDFYFNINATQGFDYGYDANVWGDIAPEFAIYSHLVQDNVGDPVTLQALSMNELNNVTIPLGVNANQGEQLIFSIADMNLPTSVNVYLEDVVANTVTLLNDGNYVMTPNVDLNGTGRFFLRTSNDTLSTLISEFDDILIYTDNTSKNIIIEGQLLENNKAILYDIHGRVITAKPLDTSNTTNFINIDSLSSGVYIIKLLNKNKMKTQKLIIH